MPDLSPASADVREMIRDRVNSGHYPDLVEAEVTINAMFAYADEGKPALKLHGYACAATIKINSAKDRIEGKKDATMTVDERSWKEEWSEAEKIALIDHELMHLAVCRSKPTRKSPEEYILSDAAGRPKLKMRLHDIVEGGFSAIAARHGVASHEVKIARSIRAEFGQLLFDWGDDQAPPDEMPSPRLVG